MRFLYLRDPLFLICCVSYGVNRFLVKPHLQAPFSRFWFNDLLLIPCALPVVLWLFRRMGLRGHDAPPQALEIGWIVVVWALLFEWVGPGIVAHATGDAWDVMMYMLGAIGAWVLWNRPQQARSDEF